MAIFHLRLSTVARSAGHSAVAAAAYRGGTRLDDERTGVIHDYRRRSGVLGSGLVNWPWSSRALWNAAEAAERRRDAVVAREVTIAVPHELSRDQSRDLVRGFAQYLADRHGVAVEWVLHAAGRQGDERNVHAHMLLTTRRVVGGGLGEKTRELDMRTTGGAHLTDWRRSWAARVNAALAAVDAPCRVDHRSHRDRGTGLDPLPHLGKAVVALERRGIRTRRGDQWRAAVERRARIVAALAVGPSPPLPPAPVLTPEERERRFVALVDRLGGEHLARARSNHIEARIAADAARARATSLLWWRFLARRRARADVVAAEAQERAAAAYLASVEADAVERAVAVLSRPPPPPPARPRAMIARTGPANFLRRPPLKERTGSGLYGPPVATTPARERPSDPTHFRHHPPPESAHDQPAAL